VSLSGSLRQMVSVEMKRRIYLVNIVLDHEDCPECYLKGISACLNIMSDVVEKDCPAGTSNALYMLSKMAYEVAVFIEKREQR